MPRTRPRALLALCVSLTAVPLAFPVRAAAHALVGRQDLPIPEWLFAWGASVVLIVSFVALSIAWRESRFEADRWREAPAWLSRLVCNPVMAVLAGAIGVALLAVVIWSGLYGTEAPDRNFSVTFVFVTAWLGLVAVSVLLGDVFRAFNPWRAIAKAASAAFRLVAGQSAPPAMAYPERLGRWPAAIGLFAFLWLELVYGQSGFQTVGLTPRTVAVATLVYSAYTFVAMALFGIDKWLDRGETFSVYFGMFSRLAPVEVRDGTLGRRPFLSGTTGWATGVSGSLAMVLVTIGGTTYDGAQEGALNSSINWLFEQCVEIGLGPVTSIRLTNTVFLLITMAFVCGLFWAGIAGMHTVGGRLSTRELGRAFAHAFIPIGLAYLVAHYFSLVLFQGQAQFTYLLSDPLGDGSNYFGTAETAINYGVIGATAIWYVQVAALVIGHALALVLGHDRALAIYGNARQASRSQYWMLAMMVGFTCLGLFLLSQANG